MHDLQCVQQCTCLKYGHIHTESGVGVLCPHSPYETIPVFHRTRLCAGYSSEVTLDALIKNCWKYVLNRKVSVIHS